MSAKAMRYALDRDWVQFTSCLRPVGPLSVTNNASAVTCRDCLNKLSKG